MALKAITDEQELHWLALHLVPGLGARRTGQLLVRFRTPEAIFRADPEELEAAGLSGSVAQSVASGCTFDEAAEQQRTMRDVGATLITLTDARYPEPLRDIYDPPPVLFARGHVELLASVMIGVVGTRRPSPYGTLAAERLSADLSQTGVTIASGMAKGIDTAAHRATLSAGGNTVAVFGCGVDRVYPAENRKLADEIAAKGLVVSEFPMGAPPYPQNFPVRNRIVSGMSAGVLVVEGAQYSGSGITARVAAEQGREVFAVPGNITSKMSWGPNLLIKQGAKLVQDIEDVLSELSPDLRRRLVVRGQPELPLGDAPAGPDTPLGALSKAVLAQLKPDAGTHLDELIDAMPDHSSTELIAAMFELEMSGVVRQLPGRTFIKVW